MHNCVHTEDVLKWLIVSFYRPAFIAAINWFSISYVYYDNQVDLRISQIKKRNHFSK